MRSMNECLDCKYYTNNGRCLHPYKVYCKHSSLWKSKGYICGTGEESMTEYERGYARALEDINRSMCVVAERWKPSKCPRCEHSFDDYEECNDGYYNRAKSLERCPYCGQKLDWDVVDW